MSTNEPIRPDGEKQVATDPEAEKRSRMRHDWDNLIEDLIEEGRQRGLFDDLSGKGRPLEMRPSLYEGSAALSNQLLKDNNLRPVWLSHRLSVQERIEQFRSDVARTWQRYDTAFQQAVGETHRTALTIGWDDECRRWEREIVEINKLVSNYNLRRPTSNLEIFSLRISDELKRVQAPRYLL
jgi:DnaJ family protein C protein 28